MDVIDEGPAIDGIHPAPDASTNWRQWWAIAHQAKLNENSGDSAKSALDSESNRKLGNYAKTGVSTGISIAEHATGTSVLAAAGGAALGATGIGLVAAGAVMTVVSSVQSGVSYVKTTVHLKGLLAILKDLDKYADCYSIQNAHSQVTRTNTKQHEIIAHQILPYIISQKDTKQTNKAWGMAPVVGTSRNFLQSFWHNIKKRWDGTLGVKRNRAAQWLAYHFINAHCPLADAIIDELLGPGSTKNFDKTDYHVLAEVLANKMKST